MSPLVSPEAAVVPDITDPASHNPLLRLAAWLKARDARVRDARHLRELPDYLLRDVGLHRATIDSALSSGTGRPRR